MKEQEIEKLKKNGYVEQFQTIEELIEYLDLKNEEIKTISSIDNIDNYLPSEYWFNVLMTPFRNSVYISIEVKNTLCERTDELKNIAVINFIVSYKDVEKFGESEVKENRLLHKYDLKCSQCGVINYCKDCNYFELTKNLCDERYDGICNFYSTVIEDEYTNHDRKSCIHFKHLTCSQCGVVSDDVKRVIDPYQEDMFGREEWVNLCSVCYQDNVMSI